EALRKQAANAGKYKEFKDQERKLKAELLALKLRQLTDQGQAHAGLLAELTQAMNAAKAAVGAAHQEQSAIEAASREANHALSEQQNKVYEVEAGLARQEQNLRHAQELKALK